MLDFPRPPNVAVGDLYPDPAVEGLPQWVWDGERWMPAFSGGGGVLSSSGGTISGDLAVSGVLRLAGDPQGPLDAATKQYVDDEVQEVAGADGGGPQMGVTDGSNAAPGEVGEVISATISLSITMLPTGVRPTGDAWLGTQTSSGGDFVITPGDWQVYEEFFLSSSVATATAAIVRANVNTRAYIDHLTPITPSALQRSCAGSQSFAMVSGYSGFRIDGNLSLPQVVTAENAYFTTSITVTYSGPTVDLGPVTGTLNYWARRMR